MAKLENQASEFWYKLIDSDTIKNGITLLTDLLGLLTDIVDVFGVGGLATIGAAGFGIHEFIKNFAWLVKGDNNFKLSYSF